MEKRLFLAVVLMAAAIMFTNLVFPPPEPPTEPEVEEAVDTSDQAPAAVSPLPLPAGTATIGVAAVDTVVVQSELYRYGFATRGAALVHAELLAYPSYDDPEGSVQLVPEGVADFLTHRLVVGTDTIDLGSLPFEASVSEVAGAGRSIDFGYRGDNGFAISLRYGFRDDGYLIDMTGRVDGLGGRPAALLTSVGPGLEMHEHPDHHSERELAVVVGPAGGGVDRLVFRNLEGRRVVDAPIAWAGVKDKYFLTTVIGGETPLSGAEIVTHPPVGRVLRDGSEVEVPRASISTVLPLDSDGEFRLQAYVGPQDYGRLSAIGYDLEEVTPYGYRWLQPVIRPLAAAVLWVLNTLHDTLGIAYGWVLVIFGVMMRVVLWPLNAKAMRAQMKNMALQPMLQEIQEKYRNDREKQQAALLEFYREHKFNPFGGCLPLLVPFPVLITLFFVFQNTIAFRGAAFLWLPDLSLRDPFYILPFILVVSMFALQWVSAHLSGMDQNPQMKMMMYIMPVMMGVIFFMLPSGLNLYYAVTQVASIPQQVLIAKERRKAQEEMKKAGGKKPAPRSGKGKPRSKR